MKEKTKAAFDHLDKMGSRYFSTMGDKRWVNVTPDQWVAILTTLRAAEGRIAHGEYCVCATANGRAPDSECDCGKVTVERAFDELAKTCEAPF